MQVCGISIAGALETQSCCATTDFQCSVKEIDYCTKIINIISFQCCINEWNVLETVTILYNEQCKISHAFPFRGVSWLQRVNLISDRTGPIGHILYATWSLTTAALQQGSDFLKWNSETLGAWLSVGRHLERQTVPQSIWRPRAALLTHLPLEMATIWQTAFSIAFLGWRSSIFD